MINLFLSTSFLIVIMMFLYYLNRKIALKRIINISKVSKIMKKEGDKISDDKNELKKLVKQYQEREEKQEKTEKIYKISMIVLAFVTAILLLWQVILPIFIHGDTNVALGGKDVELKSDGTGEWSITIQNDGSASSKNVDLRVKFNDDIKIDYSTLFCKPSPNYKVIETNSEIEYRWNNLDTGQDNDIYLHIDASCFSSLIGKTKPQFVEVRADGEGVTYRYSG